MKKRLIAALIFAITLIYLSISVSAVGTFGSKAYIYVQNSTTSTTSRAWQEIEVDSGTLTTINNTSGSFQTIYLHEAFKVNQVPQDGYILVVTLTLKEVSPNSFQLIGAGQLDSNTLPTANTTAVKLAALDLNQEIIAQTVEEIDTEQVRLTVTFKASGFVNQYPVVAWKFSKDGSLASVSCASAQLYESIEEAGGSGVTPEEMREVLSSWSEEELIPGIGQAVGDKIEEVVPDAILDGMEEHDNQLKTEGGSVIENIKEQIGETITPYFENTDQIRDAIHGGASGIFGYAGTDAVITLPAARNPLTGNSLMWNEYQIDLGMYYNRLPAVLRQLISALLTLLVSIGVIRELLDTVNTILIHREILGMPDDYLKSWTRKDDF